tara:strand:- start:3495 stop:4481 length:987 start_codon:yes stop_codon:yes gene_type:complete
MSNYTAVTIGDINGIGIEILIKLWKKNKIKKIILFTDVNIINKFLKKRKIKLKINIINENFKNFNYKKNNLNIFSYQTESNAENTYKSLKFAYKFCKKKICIGVITLPIRKDIIKQKIDKNFIGHTEYFQNIDNKKYSNMILYHEKIIISPLTTHIAVNNISKIISNKKLLYNQIKNLTKTLKIDFNIKKPRLIISGLNPHAGENGNIGKEEIDFIAPVIKKLRKIKILIDGPKSPDSMLINNNLKEYDCFIFMYHDQALIPFKYISQFSGINYTGNLSIIRVSPDHGTAYNLVGSKKISDLSLLNCYNLIKKIDKNKKINDKNKKVS